MIKATADGQPDRYINLQPEDGGRIALIDNLSFATSLTYPEAWLLMQNPKVQQASIDFSVQLDIATLVDVSSLEPLPALPIMDHNRKG